MFNLIDIMLESDSKTLITKMESLENEIANLKKEIKNTKLLIVPTIIPADDEIIIIINKIKKRILSDNIDNLRLILRHYVSKVIVDDKTVYIEYNEGDM